MHELAMAYGKGSITVKTIAENQGISDNYLEQLMGALKKAGFVKSVRGAQGGYMLAKAPKDITIGEIIVTMEGPVIFADCMLAPCEKAEGCGRRNVWSHISDKVNDVLNSITLADLVRESNG
jgi:Rrf2 family protein